MDNLKEIILRIARPLEYATRSGTHGLSALKDLGRFVSQQVVTALGHSVHPPSVEADLLHLVHLFSDYETLGSDLRGRRVTEAKVVLNRLLRAVEEPAAPSPDPPKLAHRLWELPIQYARGVGPKKAEVLARAGIHTIEDAIWSLPWRYEDRTQVRSIGSLLPGQEAVVAVEIQSVKLTVTARQRRKLVEATALDETGRLDLVWFNQAYLAETFRAGQHLMLFGLVKARSGRWTHLQMENPAFEILEGGEEAGGHRDRGHGGRIVPIYPGREPKTRMMLGDRFRAIMKVLVDQYADGAVDALPAEIARGRRLMAFGEAIKAVHFPAADANLDDLNRGRTAAHRRFAFEDFFLLELALGQKRESVKREARSLAYNLETPLPRRFLASLPFCLTEAQLRVLQDIHHDLASPHPMNRLIQGDVGCGKTVVATVAMLVAVGSGLQAALMAPTEILAEQHYLNLHGLPTRRRWQPRPPPAS